MSNKITLDFGAYEVQIIDRLDDEVVRRIPAATEGEAQAVKRGVQINLNHAGYRAVVVEEDKV